MNSKTELERTVLRYSTKDQRILLQTLDAQRPNNPLQQQFFDRIMSSIVDENEENTYFISGAAGTGTCVDVITNDCMMTKLTSKSHFIQAKQN
jgi:ATP-dependent phosphoenolpyruvate carboxykinase